MATLNVQGKNVELDEEGYLINEDDWDEQVPGQDGNGGSDEDEGLQTSRPFFRKLFYQQVGHPIQRCYPSHAPYDRHDHQDELRCIAGAQE